MNLADAQIAVLAENMYQELELWYPVLRLREAGPRLEQLGLGDHGSLAAVVGQLETRAERDRLGRACLGAVAAVDAAHEVDLVALGVPLAG